jgi:hypothetical protein
MHTTVSNKRQHISTHENTVETSLKGFAPNMAKNVAEDTFKAFGDIGAGIGDDLMDMFLGQEIDTDYEEKPFTEQETDPGNFQKKVEFKRLYDFDAVQEKRTMKELIKKIDNEIQALKKANSALASEVKDIEKVTLSSADEKTGIYHIRFLEQLLTFIKALREKVNDSSSWLACMNTKKKKRGYMGLAKKKGTSFSMSEELKMQRSVQ